MTTTPQHRHTTAAPTGAVVSNRLRDERGVALVIVLTIVALLTITVIEFTYTVQLDMHRARNALDAMQAKLLARSGVNLAAAFLARDEEEKFDAPTEEWAIALDEFCRGVEIAPTALMRCSVEDESGKINVNNTRPKGDQAVATVNTPDAYLRDGLESLAARYGIDVPELGDQVREYWLTPPPMAEDETTAKVPEFATLEEFAARFRIPTSKLKKLRRMLTALPASQLKTININTAYPEVLTAIIVGAENNGDAVVQNILTRREEAPIEQGEIDGLITDLEEEHRAALKKMLGTNSRYFRLQASALTNVDPTGVSPGGIGETLSVLVSRSKYLPRGGSAQDQQFSWTFRLMDWQKEAGARLFRQAPGEDVDDADESDLVEDESLER